MCENPYSGLRRSLAARFFDRFAPEAGGYMQNNKFSRALVGRECMARANSVSQGGIAADTRDVAGDGNESILDVVQLLRRWEIDTAKDM